MLVHIYDSNEIRKLDSKPPEDEKAIFEVNLDLRQLVLQSLKMNTKTLNIGGDHTMALGTVSAFLECFEEKEKMIIWIDAHADVNTRHASKSGHYHGMPLAFLLGLDKDEKFPIKVLLKSQQLIYVGLRDVDAFERNQVRIRNIIELRFLFAGHIEI
jgi:arginase